MNLGYNENYSLIWFQKVGITYKLKNNEKKQPNKPNQKKNPQNPDKNKIKQKNYNNSKENIPTSDIPSHPIQCQFYTNKDETVHNGTVI